MAAIIIAAAGTTVMFAWVVPYLQTLNAPKPNPNPFANMLTNLTLSGPVDLSTDAAADAYFASNGTDGLSWATAYVLDHVAINQTSMKNEGSPIYLYGTSRYIIIRDCYLGGSEFDPVFRLEFCEHVMVEHCVIASGADGIELYDCSFMNVTNNMFWENNGFDIDLSYVHQSAFTGNQMIGNGVSFLTYGNEFLLDNVTFSETNTVNGHPIIYDIGRDGVQIAGGTYAQILLINCTNSQVNAVTIEDYQNALFVDNCTNVTIDGATATNQCLSDIFALKNSNNTCIQNCDVENAGFGSEISMGNCVNATISNNQVLNSQNMNVYLAVCENVTISNNLISNATWEGGIFIDTCSNVAVLDNNISTPVLTDLNVVSDNQTLVVWDSIGISVQGNTLNGFFYFKNTYNITCDSTNTLNGRRLYYYENLPGLKFQA